MAEETVLSDMNYCIVTDAASDLDDTYLKSHPEVHMIPMSVVIDNKSYTYGPGGDLTLEQFYEMLESGSSASTSQININTYLKFFAEILSAGKDILYLCFSSGMSGMYQNAVLAAKELLEEYPERRIFCVDTLCAAPGEGFLVREAAARKQAGAGLTELAQWAEASKLHVIHWFTVDGLDYLHRGGRVSAMYAVMGTALQIKPLLCMDDEGKLKVVGKPRGAKRSMSVLLEKMAEQWDPNRSPSVAVVHSCCPERAEQLQSLLKKQFPAASVYKASIGPIIGTHTGPGLLAVVFWGSGRAEPTDSVSHLNQ